MIRKGLKRLGLTLLSLALIFSPATSAYATLNEKTLDRFAQNDILFYDPSETCAYSESSYGSSDGSDVYLVGDSISVLSKSKIEEALPEITIDAQSSIWFSQSQEGLTSGVDRLGSFSQDILVFALGTNGGISSDDIKKLTDKVDSNKKIILMTIYYNGHSEEQMTSSNAAVHQAVSANNNITFFDWNRAASENPEDYISSDGTHPTEDGMTKFAELIKDAVNNVTTMKTASSTGDGNYANIMSAKNADKSVFNMSDGDPWVASFSDGDNESMKRLLENYGDLAYQLGNAVGAPYVAILVQMRYEDPKSVCGKNNFWGNGCDPSHAYTGGSTIQGENLGEGFSQYGKTLTNGYYDAAKGITDPIEYLETIGPIWVQGDPNGAGYGSIDGMRKSVKALQAYIDSAEGQEIVSQFGNYHGTASSGECRCDSGSGTTTSAKWENGWLVDDSIPGMKKEDVTNKTDLSEAVKDENSWTTDGPNKILLHTTEGVTNGYAAYPSGNKFPAHFIVDLKKKEGYQSFSINQPSLAIKDYDAAGPIQIEIVGFSDSSSGGYNEEYDVNNFGDEEWDYLVTLLRAISEQTNIPLTSSVNWENPSRLSEDDFKNYKGILGHMHATNNDHNDPGNIWSHIEDAINRSGGYDQACSGGDYSSITSTAISLAYPIEDRLHDPWDPKEEYRAALAETGVNKLGDSCSMNGNSCDAFVATVMRKSGADPDFPCCGAANSRRYLESSSKYIEVPNNKDSLRSGDIRSSNGHIELYVEINGEPFIASASHCDRTGGIGNFYENSGSFKAFRLKD